MKIRLLKLAALLSSSFWFVPSLIVLCGLGLALGLVSVDVRLKEIGKQNSHFLFSGGADGARSLLSAIASSMITVTGVTFSTTVVALTLAAGQYTPRVLRRFTSDRGNQTVLGVLLATFLYALVVLRFIRGRGAGEFVPHVAVTGGMALALVSVATLIYFIHHATASLRPNTIMERVSAETCRMIRRLFPDELGEGVAGEEVEEKVEPLDHLTSEVIPAPHQGYIETVDIDGLLEVTMEEEIVVRMEAAIGDFLSPGETLLTVWSDRPLSEEVKERVMNCLGIGRDRTMQQDPEFGIVQIVDIAVKALSPGINDPTTALNSLDYLGSILRQMGERRIPSRYRKGPKGELRVIAQALDFEQVADLAFNQIRHYGKDSLTVLLYMLKVICKVAPALKNDARRKTLRRHAQLIAEIGRQNLQLPTEIEKVEAQKDLALRLLT